MKFVPQTLPRGLEADLAPLWLLAGNEPLLIAECADQIRARARALGVLEREVQFVDRGYDWNSLLGLTQSMSLFGDRRLIELRLNAKPGPEGTKVLAQLHASPPSDVILLLIYDALEWADRSAAWVQAFEAHSVLVSVEKVEAEQLPGWVAQRLVRAGVRTDADVAELIAARCEGNLVAAHQEIERLALLAGDEPLTVERAAEWVANSARYGVFQLGEAVLAGEAARALKILAGLEAEGEEPTLVLWCLAEELRALLQWSPRPARGAPARLWRGGRRRQELLARAATRLPRARVEGLLAEAREADLIIKGARRGRAWDALATIAAGAAGVALPLGRP